MKALIVNLRLPVVALCTLPLVAERLVYSAGWRLFDAGRATIQFGASEASVVVETHGVVGKLHPVNDRYRSTYSDGMCAISSLLRADEGDEQSETVVTFEAGLARRVETDLKLKTKQTGEVATPACVHDLVGGLMKMRGLHLKPGTETTLPLSDGRKSIQARVAAVNVEMVTTKAGQFRAVRHEVFLYNGAFFRKKGRLFVWISDDEQRLPVKMKVELPFYIGDVTVALDSVTASATQQAFLRN
jgi:Protein of unknown function (DUF3108)